MSTTDLVLHEAKKDINFLNVKKDLSPEELWAQHTEKVLQLGQLSAAAKNVTLWSIGTIYHRLQENPEMYFSQVEKAPKSTRNLGEHFGISHTHIRVGANLAVAYTPAQILKYCKLNQNMLVEAQGISEGKREEVLDDILEKREDDTLSSTEGMRIIQQNQDLIAEAKVEEVEDTEQDDSESSTETKPPINTVKSGWNTCSQAIRNIHENLNLNYKLVDSDIQQLKAVREKMEDISALLDEVFQQAEDSS